MDEKTNVKAVADALQLGRAAFWRVARKVGVTKPHDSLRDQIKDQIAPFDEYPACEMCGSNTVSEKLVTRDKMRIVECADCSLWFTSPRIEESVWTDWLKTPSDRSIEFTENRLKYGVSLTSNTKYVTPDWHKRKMKRENSILDEVEEYQGEKLSRIHDVGCGVGYLMQAARSRGMDATGNELNAYAWQVMNNRLGLTVYNDILPSLDLESDRLDSVIMHDYIEHSYHPLNDLRAAYDFLKPGGALYIETFHIDCYKLNEQREDWPMLFWSHTFHFSTKTLSDMVTKAGFRDFDLKASYQDELVTLLARK